MEPAIEANGLVKTYPKGVSALRRAELRRRGGHDLRPARTERRRQVHRGQDPHHARRSRTRAAPRVAGHRRRRARPTGCAGRSASSRRARASTARPRAARTCACRARSTACAGAALEARVAELLERFGLADAADRIGARLLGRHAAPPRHRHGARPPTRRCCSSTSRRPGSTPRCAPTCGRRSPACRPSRA